MNSPLAGALRAAAGAALPEGAFLRRDRAEGLFVTDAPRRQPLEDWPARLAAAGFDAEPAGTLLRLRPGAAWLVRLEAQNPAPPDDLCAGLLRFWGLPCEAESLRLFALGARCLDGGDGAARFDRLLRQRAAVCLRLNAHDPNQSPRGGGLYACALLDHELEVWTT